jgi:hypothetical protein
VSTQNGPNWYPSKQFTHTPDVPGAPANPTGAPAARSKPVACWIGLHAWHPIESEPGFPLIACLRCGKQEIPSRNIAARLGWNQHMNG